MFQTGSLNHINLRYFQLVAGRTHPHRFYFSILPTQTLSMPQKLI